MRSWWVKKLSKGNPPAHRQDGGNNSLPEDLPPARCQDGIDNGVECCAGSHGLGGEEGIWRVVTAQIDRLALCADQLPEDPGLARLQLAGNSRELAGQARGLSLVGQGLCPIESQVKVGATVVQFHDLALRRLARVH